GRSMIAQMLPHLPVPVREKAVAETEEDTQHKPREGRQHQRKQVPPAEPARYPPEQIEHDQGDVKYKEKYVGQFIPPHDCTFYEDTDKLRHTGTTTIQSGI